MKGFLIIGIAFMLLLSCSVKRNNTSYKDYNRLVSELQEMVSSSEKRLEMYKDSIGRVKSLTEKSGNVADSSSHLETSYAQSNALIKGGKLYHSIENKDSIPVPIKYIRIEIEKHDTIFRDRIDTIYIDKEKEVKTVIEKKRFANTFFYVSGWIAWILIVCGSGIWFRYKIKKSEK